MMFKRIDHVEIVTDQLDRTVRFYTEVLGFTIKARDRIERSGMGVPIDLVYLDLGGTVVELISYDGATVDPAPEKEHLGYRMIALEVDDRQKAADYLRTKSVDIVWGPKVRETYSRAEICDPNGYFVRIDELGHESRDALLQLPDLVRMFKLHGGSLSGGPDNCVLRSFRWLQNWLNYVPPLAMQPAGPYRGR
jgi:glyoxylase I family protein